MKKCLTLHGIINLIFMYMRALTERIFDVITFITVFVAFSASAQKTVSLNGKYSYVLGDNDNVTIREAKIKCVELAKAEALKTALGTIVSSDFINSDRVVNDEFSSYCQSEALSSVKGEWLGDERDP